MERSRKKAKLWLSRGSSACVSQTAFERTTRASPAGSAAARAIVFVRNQPSSSRGVFPSRYGAETTRSHAPFGLALWTPPLAGSFPRKRLIAP